MAVVMLFVYFCNFVYLPGMDHDNNNVNNNNNKCC